MSLNHSTFHMLLHVAPVGTPAGSQQLEDVVVSLQGPRGAPVTLGTRVLYNSGP